MLLSALDNWYTCQLDMPDTCELCRIRREAPGQYYIITYYDGKIVHRGSLDSCHEWIKTHWIERRYLDQYGN